MSEPMKKLLHFGRHKGTGSYYSQERPITWEMLEPCGQIEIDEGVWVLFSKEPLEQVDAEIAALRARQAVLVEALTEAIELIRAWRGPEAWGIYYEHSPEMKRLRAALAQGEG